MSSLVLQSPAKLNLFLHIVGRRSDGYHLLQTVFQLIDYCDTLSFSLRHDETIQLIDNTPDIAKEDNLIMKAVKALKINRPHLPGVDIHLEKRIPTGSGMGGGSSNAATTLLALNHLWELSLDIPTLKMIGLKIGADVPVFVEGHSAFAQGIGEKLKPIHIPPRWYAIVKPPIHADTKTLFSDPQLSRHTPSIRLKDYEAGIATRNDFLPVLLSRYPSVKGLYDALAHFGQPYLTGSGSAFFVICESREEAEKCIGQMNKQVVGFVAQGIDESPVHVALHA